MQWCGLVVIGLGGRVVAGGVLGGHGVYCSLVRLVWRGATFCGGFLRRRGFGGVVA